MDRQTLRARILDRLHNRLVRMGLSPSALADDLDLVQAGVLDSLGFVDLFADLIDATGKEIDLEAALAGKGTATMKGLLDLFSQ